MIVFDLCCGEGHRFEGWFGSSDDFAAQQTRGLVACPRCGSAEVAKAPMAPAVPRKGNQQVEAKQPVAGGKLPPQAAEMLAKLANGDEVITNGGVAGTVTTIGDSFVTVEIADNVRIRVQKGAIANVLPKGTLKSA